ncbi:MAG: hypothetical protein KatS3mg014_2274 [Actinomycetota bacterium]|nr:MAG: hypothetical protein KatS3mg014_2274 [Actinomycetota bacterium]
MLLERHAVPSSGAYHPPGARTSARVAKIVRQAVRHPGWTRRIMTVQWRKFVARTFGERGRSPGPAAGGAPHERGDRPADQGPTQARDREGAPGRAAVRVPAEAGVRGARLAPDPRVPRRDEGAVGVRAVAAGPHGEEPRRVQACPRRPPPRRPVRGHRARPAGAGHDADADPAPHDQPHEHRGPVERPGPPVHGPRVQRARPRVPEPPDGLAGLPPRGGHVARRGAHPPLPHEGPRGDDPHLPAVLRPLHPDGPRGDRHGPGPQVQVRAEAAGPLAGDARLPAADPDGAGRGRLRRRRREHPHRAPEGLAVRAVRHPQHPRRAPRHEGPHGPAPALPPGRGAARVRGDRQARPRARDRDRRAHPRERRPAGHAAVRQGRREAPRHGLPRRPQPRACCCAA